jgi:type VI secretion system protein VasG
MRWPASGPCILHRVLQHAGQRFGCARLLACQKHFQPALLARFQTIVYRQLSTDALTLIVRMKLDKIAQRIKHRFDVPLACDDALVAELVSACLLPDSGARNIDSLLDQQILPVLSRELLMRIAQRQMPKTIRLACSPEQGIVVDFDDATP